MQSGAGGMQKTPLNTLIPPDLWLGRAKFEGTQIALIIFYNEYEPDITQFFR
jgi:hypothetical protein